ncbi:hypothetical protein [Streptomyces sp. NPDC054837]
MAMLTGLLGRLRCSDRTTTLGTAVRHALANQLHAGDADRPAALVGWDGPRESRCQCTWLCPRPSPK